jgi:hypothetical protein
MSYKEGGYYAKYTITRTDGKPFVDQPDEFMVLCFRRDPHARVAALAYADSVEPENAEFAKELRDAIGA